MHVARSLGYYGEVPTHLHCLRLVLFVSHDHWAIWFGVRRFTPSTSALQEQHIVAEYDNLLVLRISQP